MGLYDDLPAARAERRENEDDGDGDDDKEKRTGGGTSTRNDVDVAVAVDAASKRAAWSTLASSARGSASKEARKPTGAMLRAQASAMRAAKARRERERLEARGAAKAREAATRTRESVDEVEKDDGEKSLIVDDAEDSMEETIEGVYDPMEPNDYERVLAERVERVERRSVSTASEALRVELEKKRRVKEAERGMKREQFLNVDGKEVKRRRMELGRYGGGSYEGERRETPKPDGDSSKPQSVAERMMAKMGWSKGKGLGKSEQGMTTPLEVRKDGATSGRIVNAPVAHDGKGHSFGNK